VAQRGVGLGEARRIDRCPASEIDDADDAAHHDEKYRTSP
jgi:hypothetical protein